MGAPIIGGLVVILALVILVAYLATRARQGRAPVHESQEPSQVFGEPVQEEIPRAADGGPAGAPRDPARPHLNEREQG